MSRFYASIKGNRGPATRGGDAKSGIQGHIRGWNIGVAVRFYVNDAGVDEGCIYLTGGSKGGNEMLLGTVARPSPGKTVVYLKEPV